jgi:hypothetical protein
MKPPHLADVDWIKPAERLRPPPPLVLPRIERSRWGRELAAFWVGFCLASALMAMLFGTLAAPR